MAAEAPQQPTGLQLPDMTVSRISGPVSMYYLKPNIIFYDSYHQLGIDLPLILLFGDVHRSESGLCDSCECTSPDACCKLIHDKEFIKQFDKIAQETPVDFYTESSPKKETYSKHGADVLFKDFIYKTVAPCHRVSLRTSPSYTTECPTKFIRWHYGDIRTFSTVIEGFMIFPIETYIESILASPYRSKYDTMHRVFMKDNRHIGDYTLYKQTLLYNVAFLSDLREPLTTQMPITIQDNNMIRFIKSKHKISIEDFLHFSDETLHVEYMDMVKEFVKKYAEYITQDMSTHMIHITYTLTKRLESSHKIKSRYIPLYLLAIQKVIRMTKSYLEYIKEASHEGKSGIYKQLHKITVPIFQDMNTWIPIIIDNLIRRYELIEQVILLDRYQQENPELFNKLYEKVMLCIKDAPNNLSAYSLKEYELNNETNEYIHNVLEAILWCIRYFNSNFLDIYTVMRILKTPETKSLEKETQATLVIGFFGDAHIRKILSIFMSSAFQYEIAYHTSQRDDATAKRCITITQPVPLVDDVRAHHEQRFEENNYEKSNQYYHRLRKEQRVRMSSVMKHPSIIKNRKAFTQRSVKKLTGLSLKKTQKSKNKYHV